MYELQAIHRQILYDLAVRHLEPLPGNFSRLAYVASLWSSASKTYEEKQLCQAYGREPVHQALAKCHQELFERSLELSLPQQKEELSQYFEAQGEGFPRDSRQRCDRLESWIPQQAPDYLKELFRSNLHALCELLHEQKPKARSSR